MFILPFSADLLKQGDSYLSKQESYYLKSMHSSKNNNKRLEWIAGRIAIKHAIQEYLSKIGKKIDLKNIVITKTKLGQPLFENLSVSISHTKTHAAADVSIKGKIGIDIETIRKFPDLVVQNFLNKSEQKWLASLPSKERDTYITLFWSFKEAYLKAQGVGLRHHPIRLEIIPLTKKKFVLQEKNIDYTQKLWYNVNIRENYVLTKTVIKN